MGPIIPALTPLDGDRRDEGIRPGSGLVACGGMQTVNREPNSHPSGALLRVEQPHRGKALTAALILEELYAHWLVLAHI